MNRQFFNVRLRNYWWMCESRKVAKFITLSLRRGRQKKRGKILPSIFMTIGIPVMRCYHWSWENSWSDGLSVPDKRHQISSARVVIMTSEQSQQNLWLRCVRSTRAGINVYKWELAPRVQTKMIFFFLYHKRITKETRGPPTNSPQNGWNRDIYKFPSIFVVDFC